MTICTRNRSVGFAVTLVLAMVLSGCGGGDGSSGGQSRFLSIATAPPGGAFFIVGGALAQVIQEHAGEGLEVTAEATKGSLESIRRLDSGEIELALSNSAITYFAVRGTDNWERPFPVQGLMTMAPNVMAFITPQSSGIESMSDLAGKRVVVGVAGAGWEFFARPILAAHGLTYDDFKPLYNTQAGAVDMLADGSADAAFLGGAIPTASLVQATTSQDIHFIPFDEDAKVTVVEQYPFYYPMVIPSGTYAGQEEDFPTLAFGSMHLIVNENLSEDLAYSVTRAIYENREAVVAQHAAGRSITADNVVRETGTPFHPGAIRYYREIGIWPEAEQD